MKMGNMARDKVSGFEGILTGRSEFMNGCVQWLISPKIDKDGHKVSGEWFDEGQIQITGEGLAPEQPALSPLARTGGPQHSRMPSGGGR